jgi:hypothetical protein
MTTLLHGGGQPQATLLKLVAIVLIGVPAAVLLLFAVAEMAGGDVSGVQHIPEALLLFALAAAAWRYPRPAGLGLLVGGAVLLVIWLTWVVASGRADWADAPGWFVSAAILFGLPLTAGWLLLRASRMTG